MKKIKVLEKIVALQSIIEETVNGIIQDTFSNEMKWN